MQIEKKCAVCNKTFIAKNSRYKCCSLECSHTYHRKQCLVISRRRNEKIKKLGIEFAVQKYCKKCGAKLPDNRQQYCLECLLKDYKYSKGEKHTTAYSRLSNRGYDKEMILYEIERRKLNG